MDQTLQEIPDRSGSGRAAPEGGPWVGMRPRLASVYMAALADAVAGHNDLAPTTDDPRMHSAVGAISQLKALLFNSGYHPSARNRPAHMSIWRFKPCLNPKNLGMQSLRQRLSSSGKRTRMNSKPSGAMCQAWQMSWIARLLWTTQNCRISICKEIYQSQTKPMLQELQRRLLAYGVDTVAGSVALKVNLGAASGTALGTAALAGGHVALGAASVALSVVPYHRQQNTPGQGTAKDLSCRLPAGGKSQVVGERTAADASGPLVGSRGGKRAPQQPCPSPAGLQFYKPLMAVAR